MTAAQAFDLSLYGTTSDFDAQFGDIVRIDRFIVFNDDCSRGEIVEYSTPADADAAFQAEIDEYHRIMGRL